MAKYHKLFVLSFLWSGLLHAKPYVLGTFGETFPVAEKSLIELFKERIQQVDFSKLQHQWLSDVKNYATRPTAIDIKHAQRFHHTSFDPTIVLTQDIMDRQGHLLFTKGTKINPLDYLPSYQPHWLFIDADDEEQILYTKKCLNTHPDLKIILVQGDVPVTSKIFNREVYFDQGGHLIHRFEISETPAFVYRKDKLLMIDYGVSHV
ncbi:MAG: hypothetical protein EBY16_06965 [Gammaproteobacteria bacterium]|nr:hypothetical protein [Gammaproteobacteria bacterium]